MSGITNGIVVGVDGSTGAQEALDWAVREGARRQLPVRALAVSTTAGASDAGRDIDLSRAAAGVAAGSVSRALARFPDGHDVEVDYATADGSPGHELVKASQGAALLVVGAGGTGHRHGHPLGSTVNHCLHHGHTDVAVIRPRAGMAAPARVVVGTDGSAAADRALRWAADLAQGYGSPLVVARAWTHTDVRLGHHGQPSDELAQRRWSDATREDVRRQLDTALDGRRVEATVEAPEGPPARALLELLKPDDLLVLGSRGLGGIRDLMLGSVSRACAEQAPCSVVVIRSGSSSAP
ncbi:MAG: putative stress-inducible protein [Frankiales bacterium]|nr:putative stress-inducible protein [Frankiales bacterium]